MSTAAENVIPFIHWEEWKTMCPDDRGNSGWDSGGIDITPVIEVVGIISRAVCVFEKFRGEVDQFIAQTGVGWWEDWLVVCVEG